MILKGLEIAQYIALLAGVLAVFTFLKPVPAVRMGNRLISLIIAAVAITALMAAQEGMRREAKALADTKEQALQQLRSTNAQAYLDELQRLQDGRWETELAVLDPERYKQVLSERKAEQERSLQKEIAELKQKRPRPYHHQRLDADTLCTPGSTISSRAPNTRRRRKVFPKRWIKLTIQKNS
jgi:hypothetical protein